MYHVYSHSVREWHSWHLHPRHLALESMPPTTACLAPLLLGTEPWGNWSCLLEARPRVQRMCPQTHSSFPGTKPKEQDMLLASPLGRCPCSL